MEPSDQTKLLLERVEEALNFYRGMTLDAVESRLENDPSWPTIRGLILRAFGDRGLSRQLREIIMGYVNASKKIKNLSKGDENAS
jgi:hypothetical protein